LGARAAALIVLDASYAVALGACSDDEQAEYPAVGHRCSKDEPAAAASCRPL
jgi:hypothetical protein